MNRFSEAAERRPQHGVRRARAASAEGAGQAVQRVQKACPTQSPTTGGPGERVRQLMRHNVDHASGLARDRLPIAGQDAGLISQTLGSRAAQVACCLGCRTVAHTV